MKLETETAKWFDLIVGLLVILVVAFGIYYISTGFSENRYVEEGSILYHLHVRSDMVRRFAKDFEMRDCRFYYSCGDGPAPAAEGVVGTIRGTPDSVRESANSYFTDLGLARDPECEGTYVDDEGHSRASVRIRELSYGKVEVFMKELHP